MDVYQVKEVQNNEVVKVEYTKPKFFHRIMANLIDIFIMIVLFFGLFIGTRAIVQATPYYKNVQARIFDMQIESGLYVKYGDPEKIVDIVYYLGDEAKQVGTYGREFDGVNTSDPNKAPEGKVGLIVRSINQFISFCEINSPNDRYQELLGYYDSYRLETVDDNGVHYFVRDGDKIVPNEEISNDGTKLKYFFNNVYVPFVEKRCIPFLSANVTEYRNLSRIDFKFLVFLELPVAYCLAGILTYFVPPLFFRRGRKTLGKAVYHIGLIDSRVLSPTFLRFLARFAIFFFGELLLSLASFGIPYIISFSLMVFSKKKQGFPDYMLGLYEIDTSKANIYMDYVEAQLKNELHGQAIDFKMEKPL